MTRRGPVLLLLGFLFPALALRRPPLRDEDRGVELANLKGDLISRGSQLNGGVGDIGRGGAIGFASVQELGQWLRQACPASVTSRAALAHNDVPRWCAVAQRSLGNG